METKENGAVTNREQQNALELVKNGFSIDELLDTFCDGSDEDDGLSELLADDAFFDRTSALAERIARANEPFVWSKLMKLISDDNVQAIRLYFSIMEKRRQTTAQPSATADREIESLRSDLFGEEGAR